MKILQYLNDIKRTNQPWDEKEILITQKKYVYLDISEVQNYSTGDVIVCSSVYHWFWILILSLHWAADFTNLNILNTQKTKVAHDRSNHEHECKIEIWQSHIYFVIQGRLNFYNYKNLFILIIY